LFINRHLQAGTRHGLPDLDGVLYCSKHAASAIAERLQEFRGQVIENKDLTVGALRLALACIEIPEEFSLVDLCQTSVLSEWGIDPLQVATKDRVISQRLARRLHEKNVSGFLWWSSLEPAWTNVSLFQSRVESKIILRKPIRYLETAMPELIQAANKIGVLLKK
jgi:hypothetical protein